MDDLPTPITDFRGEYAFLSNFYPCDLEMDGQTFPTLEHAFQAAKTLDFAQRRQIRDAKSPSEAKRLGRKIKRRADWFDVSLQTMLALLQQKFTRYPDLREKLLATGAAELIEGNSWNDRFYGAVWDSHAKRWVGENHLGRLLMQVRGELNT